MMDTALNINAQLHCAPDDRAEPGSSSNWHRKCKPQEVTKLSETKEGILVSRLAPVTSGARAMIRAASRWSNNGNSAAMGFSEDPEAVFCMVLFHHAICMHQSGLEHSIAEMLEKGQEQKANKEASRNILRSIENRKSEKTIIFPQVTK
ncbi:hypothetical protein [Acidovorax sp.]|uniref:hypothetical protein n=1 Tax=Acidovorax sp. TaxID=1872122 RepID=UPI002ACEFCF2|nr:hypothetical protein [Acidovorax sp.]MDZ7863090.1 hypothetical protein [Acidovorax sp.]